MTIASLMQAYQRKIRAGRNLLVRNPFVPRCRSGGGEDEEDLDELIDIDKVEGRVKASSLRKISDIVDKHPEEALAIVRTWLR